MSFFTDIWNTLRTFYEGRHEPENMRPLAEWYWRTLLSVAFIALWVVIAYGVWEFYDVLRKLSAGQNLRPSEQPQLLSKEQLSEILAAYEAREGRFISEQGTPPQIADPSR